ncbi:MAG: hypothetical protein U0941_29945 [Planctomycetaceae bacterium]
MGTDSQELKPLLRLLEQWKRERRHQPTAELLDHIEQLNQRSFSPPVSVAIAQLNENAFQFRHEINRQANGAPEPRFFASLLLLVQRAELGPEAEAAIETIRLTSQRAPVRLVHITTADSERMRAIAEEQMQLNPQLKAKELVSVITAAGIPCNVTVAAAIIGHARKRGQ